MTRSVDDGRRGRSSAILPYFRWHLECTIRSSRRHHSSSRAGTPRTTSRRHSRRDARTPIPRFPAVAIRTLEDRRAPQFAQRPGSRSGSSIMPVHQGESARLRRLYRYFLPASTRPPNASKAPRRAGDLAHTHVPHFDTQVAARAPAVRCGETPAGVTPSRVTKFWTWTAAAFLRRPASQSRTRFRARPSVRAAARPFGPPRQSPPRRCSGSSRDSCVAPPFLDHSLVV